MKRKLIILPFILILLLVACGNNKDKYKSDREIETKKESKKENNKDKNLTIDRVKTETKKSKEIKIIKENETEELIEKVDSNLDSNEEINEILSNDFQTKTIKESNSDKIKNNDYSFETEYEKEQKIEKVNENIESNSENKETKLENKNETIKETQKVWVVDIPRQEAVYEDVWVETKPAWTETTDELIDFDQIIKPRWFVTTKLGTEYFYTSREALDRHEKLLNEGYTGNWGTAEDEVEIVNKVYKTIEHKAEGYYEKKLVKEAVEEKGHWEYR